MKAQGNEALVIWAGLIILLICVLIVIIGQVIPAFFKILAAMFS